MISLTVLYPKTADSRFDMAYYLETHVPLVQNRLLPLGLLRIDLEEGLFGGSPDAPANYTVIGHMVFASADDLQNALATHGPELIADIANFTNVPPIMQVSQKIELAVPA